MTDRAAKHVFEVLELAKARHAEAIKAVQALPIDLDRVKVAECALTDAMQLCEECVALAGDPLLAETLEQLRMQHVMLVDGLASIEVQNATQSPWRKVWPWLSLAIVALALLAAIH